MSGPWKPSDIKNYITPEKAAEFLEAIAANLRKNNQEGNLIKINMRLSMWREETTK